VEICGYSVAAFNWQFRDKYDLIARDYIRRLELILCIGAQNWLMCQL